MNPKFLIFCNMSDDQKKILTKRQNTNYQYQNANPGQQQAQFADVFTSNPFFQNPEAFFRDAQNNGGQVHTSFSNNTSNNFNVYNHRDNSQSNSPNDQYQQRNGNGNEGQSPYGNQQYSQGYGQPEQQGNRRSQANSHHQNRQRQRSRGNPNKREPENMMHPQAEKLNKIGNSFYENGDYKDAVKQYQRALQFQKHWRLYKNLGWAYRRLNLFKESLSFIEKSLGLKHDDAKIQRLGGIFAFSLFRNSENVAHGKKGLRYFREALSLAPTAANRHNFLIASKTLYLFKQLHLKPKRAELLSYLKDLPKPPHCDFQISGEDDVYSKKELEQFIAPTYFDKPPKVPDYVKGKISLEVMLEPVQTPSGISYDYENIYRAFAEQGLKDPISGREFTSVDCLVKNRGLENLIDDYLQDHPWAFMQEDFNSDWKFFEFK